MRYLLPTTTLDRGNLKRQDPIKKTIVERLQLTGHSHGGKQRCALLARHVEDMLSEAPHGKRFSARQVGVAAVTLVLCKLLHARHGLLEACAAGGPSGGDFWGGVSRKGRALWG
jgi:hypothetical protein